MTPSNISAGFKKCGIYPFAANAVPVEVFLLSKSFPKNKKEELSETIEELLAKKFNILNLNLQ